MSLEKDAMALAKEFENLDTNPRKRLDEKKKTISMKKLREKREQIRESGAMDPTYKKLRQQRLRGSLGSRIKNKKEE